MASVVTAEQSKGPRQRETRLEALRRHTADYGGHTIHPPMGASAAWVCVKYRSHNFHPNFTLDLTERNGLLYSDVGLVLHWRKVLRYLPHITPDSTRGAKRDYKLDCRIESIL